MRGVIRWWNDRKGWGLIAPDDNSMPVMLTRGNIIDCEGDVVAPGDLVWFEVVAGPDGREARGAVIPAQKRT